MIEINVLETEEAGYAKPVYTFVCPMCDEGHVRDLDRAYVRNETWKHVVTSHRVQQNKIDVIFVREDSLHGMSKTRYAAS